MKKLPMKHITVADLIKFLETQDRDLLLGYDLVRNKVSWKKCESCDANGRQYYDGSTGEGLSKSPSGIDKEWLECTSCEDCGGLGFILFYH